MNFESLSPDIAKNRSYAKPRMEMSRQAEIERVKAIKDLENALEEAFERLPSGGSG